MIFLAALRWFVSVGGKVFRVVPWITSFGIVSTLASQIASILAFLLPLKVIILLGSERVPSYFPLVFLEYEKSFLIVGLGAAALFFFILHLLLEWLITRLAIIGALRLIAHSRKLTLFESQEQLLAKAYQRFAGAIASAVFIGLALLALSWVYPLQAIVVVSYCAVVLLSLVIIQRLFGVWRDEHAGDFVRLVGLLASVGFFVTFATIIFDVLMGSQVSLLWAIIALLLVRQLFRRLASLVGEVSTLYSQRLQLNALIFHEHLYAGKPIAEDSKGAWALAEPDICFNWLNPLLEREAGPLAVLPEIRWVQSGISDVLTGIVHINSEPKRTYLVKLFAKNRGALSRHEASLLTIMRHAKEPLPRLCLVEQVESFSCHLFEWPMVGKLEPRLVKREAFRVSARLFGIHPLPSLVALYTRSRPMLWQRLDDMQLTRLRLFAQGRDVELLGLFASALPSIKKRLEAMPLAIVTPELSADALWVDSQNGIWSSHWGRWTLEPVGAGWPVNEKTMPLLPQAFLQAQKERSDLRALTSKHVELAALTFAFDKACQRQAYCTARDLIRAILEVCEQIED